MNVPSSLKDKPNWLVWSFEAAAGSGKPRKIPYYADGRRRHGKNGRAADRQRLVCFDEALQAVDRLGMAGVGFAPLAGSNVVALDFDNCIGVDGSVNAEVLRLVAGTYAEVSPSGKGVRAFFSGDLGNGKDLTGEYGFEVFSSSGFVTVTGDALDLCALLGAENTVAPVPKRVEDVCRKRFQRLGYATAPDPLEVCAPGVGLSDGQLRQLLDALDPDMSYPQWLMVGMALHHETEGHGFDLWLEWSARGGKFVSEADLQYHWHSFGRQQTAPVTARLLMKLAKNAGVKFDPDAASDADFVALDDGCSAIARPDADGGSRNCTSGERLDAAGLMATPEADGGSRDSDAGGRFAVVDAAEFAHGEPTSWLIKGVLPRADLGVIYGESGSGKSFFAADMALALARGIEWRGRKTRKCRVVYVAAEGGGGFRKRLLAYQLHHGMDWQDVHFGVIHAAPDFLQGKEVVEVAQAIKAWGGADLVILDTFAQVLPGANENAGEDVGKALRHCRQLNRFLGAMVLLIHHSGKDASKGARGWSGLRAAADFEMEVLKGDGGRQARVTKQKDGDDHGAWGFDLAVVPVGFDEDGDAVDSCVVVEAAIVAKAAKEKPVFAGRRELVILEVVGEMALAQSAGIEVDAVLDACVARTPPPEAGKKDYRRHNFRNTLSRMLEHELCPFFEVDGCLEMF